MRHRKTVLVGYKGFNLANIQRFEYTPESQDQVILGSNGSGKSSLLKTLLQLVPDGKRFAKGGSQEHNFDHNGSVFKLTSIFPNKAGQHSFIMDGVEMNDGFTQATQKELVIKYVGLTPELVDLMTGKTRFSTMDANTRRQWMMRISGTDFDYAMALHKHFKEKTTGLKGTLEYLLENTHKMAGEIESLEEDYKTQDDEVAELRTLSTEIDRLLNGRIAVDHSESAITKMTQAYHTVKQRSDTILAETIRRTVKMHGKDKRTLETDLVKLRDRMMQTRGECEVHEKALEGIQSLIKHVGRETLDDPSKLLTDIATAEEELGHLLNGGAYDCLQESPEALLGIAQGIQQALSELCVTIPSNADNSYTRSGQAARTESYKRLSQYVIETQNIVSKFEAQLEHANHTPDTNCPKCAFTFKPGWDPGLIENTQNTLAKMRDGIDNARGEMEVLSTHIEEFDSYSRKLGELGNIRRNSEALKSFWDQVSDQQLVKFQPVRIPVLLATAITQLTNQVRAERIQKHLAELKSRLDLINNSGDPKYLLARADLLEAELFDKNKSIRGMMQDCGEFSEEIYHLEKLDKLVEEMDRAISDFEMYREIANVAMQEECLDAVRDQAMARLGILHIQTQRYRDLIARYENNKEQIEDVEGRFASYKLITKALSPTDGIVAEVIKGFIGHFVRMINEHIDMVWTYPMEIGAIIEEGVTLKCKFPIIINGEDNPDGDVADGSTGQVSMIDFAFKLVVMELSGLVDYPLLADEFGKDFDDEHRESLVTYIKSLMEQNRFSQLFMVSHYSSVYGAFNGAEFVVLDDRNITRPGDCNQNVVIE